MEIHGTDAMQCNGYGIKVDGGCWMVDGGSSRGEKETRDYRELEFPGKNGESMLLGDPVSDVSV